MTHILHHLGFMLLGVLIGIGFYELLNDLLTEDIDDEYDDEQY
jgi:hypothetical protein